MTAKTLFEKVWERHVVVPETADTPAVLYIDLHLTHEVTSPQAFSVLRSGGLKVRRPDRTLVTMDHSTPTDTAQIFGGKPIAFRRHDAAGDHSQLAFQFGRRLFAATAAIAVRGDTNAARLIDHDFDMGLHRAPPGISSSRTEPS